MKKLLLLITLLICSNTLFSQQTKIDSLNFELQEANIDTIKVNLLEKIANEYYYIDVDEYKSYIDSMLYYSIKANSDIHLGHTYNALGRYFQRLGNTDSSTYYYRNAINIYKNNNSDNNLAISLGNIGGVFLNSGIADSSEYYLKKAIYINNNLNNNEGLFFNYFNLGVLKQINSQTDISIKYNLKALHYAEKINNKRFISYCQSQLGILYMTQSMYNEAEKYFNDAIIELNLLKDFNAIGNQYNNLGKIYNERDNNYYKAIEYYKKAFSNFTKMKNQRDEATVLANIGRNFIQLKNIDSAYVYLNKSLLLCDITDHKQEKGRVLKDLGEIALNKNQLNKAQKLTLQSLDYIDKNIFIEDKSDALLLLSDIYLKQNLYKKSLITYKEGIKLSDSIKKVEKLEKIADLNIKYQTEKKEKENLQLKEENTQKELTILKQNKKNWLLGIGLATAFLILAITGYYYNKTSKQKTLIENLQKELHHNIKNNLSIISAFIDVTKDETENTQINHKLTELQGRIESINEVHRQLYNKKDITNLATKAYLSKVLQFVEKSFVDQQITIENDIDQNIRLPLEKSFPIGLIVNEFLTNSFKYAFRNTKNPLIKIKLSQIGKKYQLQLSDNGQGLPNDFNIDSVKTFGVRIMQTLTHQIDGNFTIVNDNGVKVNIDFPV